MKERSTVWRRKASGSAMQGARLLLPLSFAAESLGCRLAASSTGGVDVGEELVGGLAGDGAGGSDHCVALVAVHEAGGFKQPLLILVRDEQEAVLVGVATMIEAGETPPAPARQGVRASGPNK